MRHYTRQHFSILKRQRACKRDRRSSPGHCSIDNEAGYLVTRQRDEFLDSIMRVLERRVGDAPRRERKRITWQISL